MNKYEVVYTITVTIEAVKRSPAIKKAEQLEKKIVKSIDCEIKDVQLTLINEKYIS